MASNDGHYMSLAFEKMNELKVTFDMQAFNFIYGEPERSPEYGMEIKKVLQHCKAVDLFLRIEFFM